MRNKYLYITLLTILGMTPETMAQGKIQFTPRLVVAITIDQLRTDYLEAFAPLYGAGGFKRLMEQGLVFPNASYPFSPVDRAAAVASVVTGTTPYYHSIVGRKWLNKETLQPMYCTGDNLSADNLASSTIGDELKVATAGNARVYSIAPFDDAAILTAGHAADAAFWIGNEDGLWQTSPYYANGNPTWMLGFNNQLAITNAGGKLLWEPYLEQGGKYNYYQHTDNERPFKHKLTGDDRYSRLKTSGLVNAYVTDLARHCVVQESLGFDRVTDLLAVTYYAGTFNHQAMSLCQLELQDTYVRLDRELARLMNDIEQKVGAQHVLFVVTSTGYSDAESADYEKYRIPTGTFYMNRTASLLNMYFGAIWGQGRFVESCFDGQMFFNQKLLESKRISLIDACQRAQEFLSQLSGVRNVYSSFQLLTSTSEHIQKIRNAYNPARSGDVMIEVSPGWKLYNEDNHDTRLSRASFIQFPIIFMGAGAKTGLVTDRVTVDRIAPTIAKAIRIRAPNACSAEPLF